MQWTSQVALVAENPPANVEDLRDVDWIPGSGRPLEEGMTIHSSYFCLVNRLDRGPWQATVQSVAKSRHD